MKAVRSWCVGSLLSGALACGGGGGDGTQDSSGNRPLISTEGLDGPCEAGQCRPGQDCVTANGPDGASNTTCQILCQSDSQCPQDLRCNVLPADDSIPNVCVR